MFPIFRPELIQDFSNRSSDATVVYKGASETSHTGPRVYGSHTTELGGDF